MDKVHKPITTQLHVSCFSFHMPIPYFVTKILRGWSTARVGFRVKVLRFQLEVTCQLHAPASLQCEKYVNNG
jgi:hypothetical protein